MTAIDLIAPTLPHDPLPEEPRLGVCCFTGAEGPTLPRQYAIKPSFTDIGLLRAPNSDRCSVAAWRAMNHAPLRNSSWWSDGKSLLMLRRTDVRTMVLDSAKPDKWTGYVTTSYKKHGVLRCPVNEHGRQSWLFEMRLVDCTDRFVVADTWARLRAAQDSGIPRPLIEHLDIAPGYMAKIGWRVWRDFDAWARPRMHSPLYEFLTYLLPSQEELAS